MTSMWIYLLGVVVFATLQECILAQRRTSQFSTDGSNPFGGVYYSGSRVAFTPRRNSSNKTHGLRGHQGSAPSYIRMPPVTTTTAATTTRAITTSRPSSPPSHLETRKLVTERVVYKPAHYVEVEKAAAKKRKWRGRYGAWKPEHRDRTSEFAATSEYRAIQEGSYYDRSNASAPKDSEDTVFDWDSTRKQHRHRHHHHHQTTPLPPVQPAPHWSHTADRYAAAFESRMATYRPPPQRQTTLATTTHRPYRSWRTTTSTPRPSYDKTTTRYRRRPEPYTSAANATGGSYWYHQKERQRPAAAVHRTSESVSYVSGSYFPTAGGARKPGTGFAVRHRGAYDPDPVTPSPRPPVYPTVRSRHVRSYVAGSRIDDLNAHPFASISGK